MIYLCNKTDWSWSTSLPYAFATMYCRRRRFRWLDLHRTFTCRPPVLRTLPCWIKQIYVLWI